MRAVVVAPQCYLERLVLVGLAAAVRVAMKVMSLTAGLAVLIQAVAAVAVLITSQQQALAALAL
jgi:hypothetical protein